MCVLLAREYQNILGGSKMATGAKKKEEQNLKALRELTALPANKKCQECQQRGTTYADMTTFGFVCTACSGYLRGINPPHRVKSISMTTFSEAEIQKLKNGGNDISRSIWLAKWNPKLDREPDKQTELAFKEFLISKYERRQWYLSPVESKKEEEKGAPKPEPKLQPPPKSPGRAASLTKSSQAVATAASHQPSPLTTPQTTPSRPLPTSATTAGQPAGTGKVDLLGDLTNDPFAPKQPPVGGVSVLPPIGSAALLRPKSDDFGAFTGAATPAGSQPSSTGMAPGLASTQSLQSITSGSSVSMGDKYAALANLDDSLRELRVKDEHQVQQQQQALQQQQQQQAQQSRAQAFAPGGGFSGPVNPFGGPGGQQVRPGPAQQQVNPFAGGASPNRMVGVQGGFGNQPPGGGFGGFQGAGGFPGQARPSQQFGGLSQSPQQRFGVFGQQGGTGGPYNTQQQQQQMQQQSQWGAQQNFGPGVGVQGAQAQWRPPQQQQQQPQQQWGQIQNAGAVGMPGQVPGSPGGPGFGGGGGGMNMQQSNPQMQFGGFVGAGPQMQQQQQQQKAANQFNWGSGSVPGSQPQSRGMPASSGSFDARGSFDMGGSRKPSVQSSIGASWSGSLAGQPQQSLGGASSTSWSSMQSGGWSGMNASGTASFGGGGGGFNQPAPVGGGGQQNWGAFGQQQQQPGGFGAFGGQAQPQQFGNQTRPQQFGNQPQSQQFGNQPQSQQFGNPPQLQQLGGLQSGPAPNPFASQSQPHTNPFL